MDWFFPIAYLVGLTVILITGFALVDNLRFKGSISRALNMTLFLIMLPKETLGSDKQRPEKELISIMEHLYSSFSNLHSKGWNKFMDGHFKRNIWFAVHKLVPAL